MLFVAVCVLIGEFEDRPMTMSDIANYIDMPRTTVRRKLEKLILYGVVQLNGTRYTLVRHNRRASYADEHLSRVEAIIQEASLAIGKLRDKS